MRIGIFIDPAFSTSSTSDDAVVMAVGEHIISKQYYIFDTYADTSAPSRTLNAVIVMINNLIMDGYKVDFVSVENVTINKQQTDFVQKLREKLTEHQINIPIQLYEPKIKKQDRIKFNLEAIMSQKGIKFNRNMPKLNKIERQFLEFPQGNHDDIIDTVSQAVEVFRKKP
jgi:predicted phage terminase large subunit-like protein